MTPNAQALLISMRDNPDKHMRATIDNLRRKRLAGEYDSARAWFLVWNNVRDGAKRYAVTVDDKRAITTALLRHIESSIQCASCHNVNCGAECLG